MDEFTGWPSDGPTLLAEIAADNRAERWDERHEKAVRGPTVALAAALEAEFGPLRVFRPRMNRRFRPSAPPLREDTGAVARSPGGCTLAVVLSATELRVSAGHWRFDGGQVRRYRAAVAGRSGPPPDDRGSAAPPPQAGPMSGGSDGTPAPGGRGGRSASGRPGGAPTSGGDAGPGSGGADGAPGGRDDRSGSMSRRGLALAVGPDDPGEELAAILEELAGAGLVPDPAGQLRGIPRGWRGDHPRISLVSRRGLQVGRSWEVGPWLATAEPLRRVREAWSAASPVVAWLDAHVGPPDAVPPRPRPEPQS